MAEISDRAFFDYLMAEYNHPVSGWDFSYLAGRRTEIPREHAWNYSDTVVAAMKQAHAMLDMRTGGGEQLARFLALQPVAEVYATEGYAPNVITARQRLEPLGVRVFEVRDERIPLEDGCLDLVTNRHGGYAPDEVRRVLRPGCLFITQQVGDQTNLRLHELLEHPGKENTFYPGAEQKRVWNLDTAVSGLEKAGGWQIIERREGFSITRFHDVGAIVHYLRLVSWEIPDFSVEKYFDKLVEMRDLFQREGFVDVPFHSFFLVARKG